MKKSKIGNLMSFVRKQLAIFGQNYMHGEDFGHAIIMYLIFIIVSSGAIFGFAYFIGWVNLKNNLVIKIMTSSLLFASLFMVAWIRSS